MGGYGDVQLLRDDGLRLDGRKLDESRPVTIEAGILPAADGSAMVTHGLNVAVAAVYGPMEAHPRKIQRQDRAVIDVRYNMAPFSLVIELDLGLTAGPEKFQRSLLKH